MPPIGGRAASRATARALRRLALVALALAWSALVGARNAAYAQQPDEGMCEISDTDSCGASEGGGGAAPDGGAAKATPAGSAAPATGAARSSASAASSTPTPAPATGAARSSAPAASSTPAAAPAAAAPHLVVYWGVGCPHCEEARPAVAALAAEHPELVVEWVEVRRDPEGRRRFVATVEALGLGGAGIPLFVIGERSLVGFGAEQGAADLARLVEQALAGGPEEEDVPRTIHLPVFGDVDPSALSLPVFTAIIGLADGINPCAFYVLVVLLGLLLHVRSRARIALCGGIFVLMSGIVYLLFMTAWLGIFRLVGVSRWITLGLGVVLVAMGLVNLKELVWFKKGVSLMVPDKAKPGLFRRMRGVAQAASLPAALSASRRSPSS